MSWVSESGGQRLTPVPVGYRDVLVLAGLAATGFVGNLLALPLGAGLHLMLGGVAVIFTALRRSLVETAVVAAIASVATFFVCNHPYNFITLTAEALVVGALYHRGRRSAVVYDLGFWLIAGGPLVFIIYGPFNLGLNWLEASVVALKQLANGVAYTAAACVVHDFARRRWPARDADGPSMRLADILTPILVLFAALPTLAIVAWDANTKHQSVINTAHERLRVAAAGLAENRPSDKLGPAHLANQRSQLGSQHKGSYALALTDAGGTVSAESPGGWLSGRQARRNVGRGVVERVDPNAQPSMQQQQGAYYTRTISLDFDRDAPAGVVIGIAADSLMDGLRWAQLEALALVAAITLVCVPVAGFVSGRESRLVNRLLNQMWQVRRNVLQRETTHWPASPVSEVHEFTRGMRTLEDDLLTHIKAVEEREARLEGITKNLPGSIYQRVMDADGSIRFTYFSEYFPTLLGVKVEDVLADPWLMHASMHAEDWPEYLASVQASATALEPLDLTFRIRDKTGAQRWARVLGQPRAGADNTVIWDGIVIDDTERRGAEQRLTQLAYRKPLTDALNREGFTETVDQHLDAHGWHAASRLVMLDLQHQQDVNEAYGFRVGDELLVMVARRLEARADTDSVVGNIDGDKFAVYVPAATESQAESACADVAAVFDEAFEVQGIRLVRSAHFGHTRLGDTPRPAADLLREAETALHYAGGDNSAWQTYSAALEEQTARRVQITTELRQGLANNEFELHFQPKVDLQTGKLIGAEALLRWWHPERGLQSPGVFIPIAEQSELMGPMGDWVLNAACRHLRAWQAANLDVVRVSVNVSVVQFAAGDLPDRVGNAIYAHDIAPSALTLEVTESAFQHNIELLQRQLNELHAMGVRLSLDDFGTGYSSLLYLQQFTFDEIKIDKGFVMNMDADGYNTRVIDSVVSLANGLGAGVIAEGVESEAVAANLVARGCCWGQGFYYAMPMADEDFQWMLANRSTLPLANSG